MQSRMLLCLCFICIFMPLPADPRPSKPGQFILAIGDEQWSMIQTWDDAGAFTGLYSIFLRKLSEKMKWESSFWPLPWVRAQKSVENGESDALIAVTTPARLEYAMPMKDPVFSLFFTIYYSIDHPRTAEIKNIRTLEDIKKYGFSTVSNRGNGWHMENVEGIGIPTTYVLDDANMLRFLSAGRADLIIDTPLSMSPKIMAMGMENQLLGTGVRIDETELVMLLSRRSPWYPERERIVQAVAEVVQSQEYRKVLTDLLEIHK